MASFLAKTKSNIRILATSEIVNELINGLLDYSSNSNHEFYTFILTLAHSSILLWSVVRLSEFNWPAISSQ